MLKLFRGTAPGTILLALVVTGVFWINAFGGYREPVFSNEGGMILYRLLTGLTGNSGTAATIISLVFVLLIAGIIIAFNTSTFFIPERSFLPGIQYIILVSLFPDYQNLTPVLPATFLLLIAIIRIAGTYRRAGTAYSYYEAALLIGTGSLFYAGLIWYGILLFAGMALLRTFSFRELAISVLGLVTPFFILFGICYVAGHDLFLLAVDLRDSLFVKAEGLIWSRMEIVTASFTGVSLLVAILHLSSGFNTKKVKSRKVISLLLWVLIITLAIYFALPASGEELIYILAIPSAYLLSHYYIFSKGKKIVPEIFFSGTLILVLLNLFLDL